MAEIVPPGPSSASSAPTPAAESDSRSLAPIGIALVILALVIGSVFYFGKAKPVATGTISNVWAVEQPAGDRTWVGVELTLHNAFDKELEVQRSQVKLKTATDEFTDLPTPRGDVARYFQAYPDLKKSDAPVLASGTKLAVGGDMKGIMLVAFPVKKADFDARKGLEIEVQFYQGTIVFKQ